MIVDAVGSVGLKQTGSVDLKFEKSTEEKKRNRAIWHWEVKNSEGHVNNTIVIIKTTLQTF